MKKKLLLLLPFTFFMVIFSNQINAQSNFNPSDKELISNYSKQIKLLEEEAKLLKLKQKSNKEDSEVINQLSSSQTKLSKLKNNIDIVNNSIQAKKYLKKTEEAEKKAKLKIFEAEKASKDAIKKAQEAERIAKEAQLKVDILKREL